MLYERGGMNSMHDSLVLRFIPPSFSREIDNYWDGLGQWVP